MSDKKKKEPTEVIHRHIFEFNVNVKNTDVEDFKEEVRKALKEILRERRKE